MRYRIILLLMCLLLSAGCVEQQNVRAPIKAPKPVTPVVGSNGLDGDEEQAVLSYHNQMRAGVGVAPLLWSKELAQHATNWATQLAAQGCAIPVSKNSNDGENIFISVSPQTHEAVVEAAKAWESEKINYSGERLNKSLRSQVGHYTQMVWRDTVQLGCAKAACKDGLVVVCDYNPVGNFLGKKPY
jgi:pathogenesis-related protein 1